MQEIKTVLEAVFNKSVTTQGNVLKLNVQSISLEQVNELTFITYRDYVDDLQLKRSGNGITIIITIQ
jgi:hypothetical protein